VRKIFSPERVKGEMLGDGLNAPEEAANLLVDTLIEKGLFFL
jgi:electron transfer flavoprotein beta subunit